MSLIVSNLSKKYGSKTVLDRLSFEMPKSGVYALLGTNGAGKTTAIRMMLGMLAKDSGEVLWNGKPLDTATCNVGYLAEERCSGRKRTCKGKGAEAETGRSVVQGKPAENSVYDRSDLRSGASDSG